MPVVRQYLLAGTANLGPVRLQTAQNPQHVIRIGLQLGLTKPAHVGMAGGTLLIIALPHQRSDGRCCGGNCCAPAAPTASTNIIDRTDIRIIIPPQGIRSNLAN